MGGINYYSTIAIKNIYGINKISNKEILEVVSKRTNIPIEIIVSLTRKRGICESRQICMFMAKHYRTDSLATIGKFFGKDHATVLHANKVINNLIDTNRDMKGFIKTINEDILKKIEDKENKTGVNDIYICSNCYSRDVEIKIWVKANSKIPSDYEAVAINDFWCCNCKHNGSLMIVKKSELENYPVKNIIS